MYETQNFQYATDPMMVCPCCDKGGLSIALLIVLEDVRRHFDKPVSINSGSRCTQYNASEEIGGAVNSEHRVWPESPNSDAADITVADTTPFAVYSYLKNCPYANLLGLGKYKEWTHVDVRGYPARW